MEVIMKKLFLLFITLLVITSAYSQVILNGQMDDANYISIAEKQNSNQGFGSNADINAILYFSDNSQQVLYLGIIGKLDPTTNDGFGIWLNTTAETGTLPGNPLGLPGGGHYIDGDGSQYMNYMADFEVDYQFALNCGSTPTTAYFDAAKNVNNTVQYIGSSDQSGIPATGPAADDIFTTNSITWAFDNAGISTSGWEIAIPYAELNLALTDSIEVFAFLVSDNAFFSDVTVPGNITGGNPGFDPDFNVIPVGPFHTAKVPIQLPSPVEFVDNRLPTEFRLFQNYPNPFNNTTMIDYQLPVWWPDGPKASQVDLSIYNLLGQKVTTLISEKQSAGSYKVEWDAGGFVSGVYLYRLNANSKTQRMVQTRKLVLIK